MLYHYFNIQLIAHFTKNLFDSILIQEVKFETVLHICEAQSSNRILRTKLCVKVAESST